MSARAPVGLGVLQVEPTDHCNLTCAMCAPHHEGWETVHGVAKGYLDADLWERVLVDLVVADAHLDHVIFQWLGDPSLHPELPRLVGAAARHLRGRVGYLRVEFAHEGGTRIAEDVCELCNDETHPVFLDWVDPTIDMYPHEGFCNCMDALDQIVAGRVRLRSGEWFGHE